MCCYSYLTKATLECCSVAEHVYCVQNCQTAPTLKRVSRLLTDVNILKNLKHWNIDG